MNEIGKYLSVSLVIILLSACVEIPEFDDSPSGNFEALWTIIDEHYCFFEYKQIDWDEVHARYAAKIKDKMTEQELFAALDAMLQELKDGHVNLITPFDLGRYWKWFEDYPANYDSELISNYLGTDYAIAGGFRYTVFDDDIGYLRYADFSSSLSNNNLDYIIERCASCRGIIIDVRNNGGGLLTNVDLIASRFTEEKVQVGYIKHKTGTGHNDFSKPLERFIEPSSGKRYTGRVVVLTNRSCYSATNDFVNAMRYFPKVVTMGDRTGGGSGLPFSSEIPNGWAVRFSASPMLDADMQQIEFGIEPDVAVNLNTDDIAEGKDTLIEAAIAYLKEGK